MRKQSVRKLLDRAGNWETRSKQAAARGDYDRAGYLRTKALHLKSEAERVEQFKKKQLK